MPSNNQRNVTNLNALPDLLDWFNSGSLVVQLEASVTVVRLLADGSLSPSTVTFTAYRDDTNNNRALYAGRLSIATSVDGVTYTPRYLSSIDQSSYAYIVPSGATFIRAEIYKAGGGGSPLGQVVASVVRDGIDGSSGAGTDAVVVNLSKSSAAVFAYAEGTVPDFAGIDGQVTVFEGTANVTASASFTVAGSGLTGTVNTATNTPVNGQAKGYYRVTAMSADIGALVITTTYNGVDYVRSFSVSKIRTGYEIVGTLPATNLFEGRLVFLTTDDKLYRYNGTAWTAAVPTTDLTGTVADAQIAGIAAGKITGTLTDAQIADLAAAKLTGTIVETQIGTNAVTTAKINAGAVTTAKIAADAVTANEIAANAITATEIASGAVTTAKIAAGAVTANEIAANTITAGKIAAATITATELATNAITADKISAGAVTAAKISVTNLAAVNANTGNLSVNGTLTLSTSGKIITSGTAYDGNGIFLGEDGAGVYKFSVGGASGRLAFDGTNLTLPGGRIVDGSVSASKISVSSLSAISATIGTLRTAASGARVEIRDNIIEVYDATRLRVRMGIWT